MAFDKLAEYPLEPVLSLTLNPKSEDAELFFATTNGFSLARIEKSQCDAFANGATISRVEPAKSLEPVKPAEPSNPIESIKLAESVQAGKSHTVKTPPTAVKLEMPAVPVSDGDDDISKLLKKVRKGVTPLTIV